MIFDQSEFDLRCEWGETGLRELLPSSRIIVIVDVLSFTTCVDIATSQGAIVFPYRYKDDSALDYARSIDAQLVSLKRRKDSPSLSPTSLLNLSAGTRLVLPSQNGAPLGLLTAAIPTIAACLRNAHAIAHHLQRYETGMTLIPAGERWQDGSLRPAIEDLIGAGAILSQLLQIAHRSTLKVSPEAALAIVTFERLRNDLPTILNQCSSGKELIAKGFPEDVELAAQLNVSQTIPVLSAGAYLGTTG